MMANVSPETMQVNEEKKKHINLEFYIQQKISFKNEVKVKSFVHTKAEKIHRRQICVTRNAEGSRSGGGEDNDGRWQSGSTRRHESISNGDNVGQYGPLFMLLKYR